MPIKNQSIKIPEKVTSSMLDKITIYSVNTTMPDEETFKFLRDKLVDSTTTTDTVFGTGQLTYKGIWNSDETILAGLCDKNPSKPSYSIRVVGSSAFDKFAKIVRLHSDSLTAVKVTRIEALAFSSLSSDEDTVGLVLDAAKIQAGLSNARIKVSVTNKGYFQLGTASSSTFCQVGLVREEGSKRPCLGLVVRTGESTAKFMSLLNERNLSVEDLIAINLRTRIQELIDCDLKRLVLTLISSQFSIPSKESLKVKPKSTLSSKGKYLNSAFKAALKDLEMPTLRDETTSLIKDFFFILKDKGFSIQQTKAKKEEGASTS
jgi:hypothetical protein